MTRVTRLPARSRDRTTSIAEVESLAWLLDNSIPVPFLGGRRFGVDAIIGLIPGFGDLASAGIGLFVVWRASRMGLPRIVVARMLVNSTIDFVVGSIPVIGDAFDLWFKANTRNLGLMRRWLEQPERSTREDWLALAMVAGIVIAVAALVLWLVSSAIAALLGAA